MGNFPLLGLDQECYIEKHDADLVALSSRPAPDIFSRWYTYCVVPWWHHLVGEKFKVCRTTPLPYPLYTASV